MPWIIAGAVIVVVVGAVVFFSYRLLVLMGDSEQMLDDTDEQAWAERGERHAE